MNESPLPVVIPNCKCINELQITTGRAGSAAGAREHTIPRSHFEAFATNVRLVPLLLMVTTGTLPAGAHSRYMSSTVAQQHRCLWPWPSASSFCRWGACGVLMAGSSTGEIGYYRPSGIQDFPVVGPCSPTPTLNKTGILTSEQYRFSQYCSRSLLAIT